MIVYVQDKTGNPLMPTKRLGMVRRWLKRGRAVMVRREPFTIRLVDVEGGYTQPLSAGLAVGTAHVGVSVVSATEEVFSAEVTLRTDISDLLTARRTFRHNRRHRQTRYRPARFRNRQKADELAPSVRAKVDETLKVIALVQSLLPISEWHLEFGNFDTHKLVNPDVTGEGYQDGPQAGYYNVREYILWRDQHTCQQCQGKRKDPQLQVHHIQPRAEGGSDRPANLITLCATCHHAHHHEKPLKLKAPASFRDPAQFNILKAYLKRATEYLAPHLTYGYLTKLARHALDLPKSHRNDAFVIAGGTHHTRSEVFYRGAFVRKQNRKLFKGKHSQTRNTIPAAFGFRRGERVRLPDGRQGFIVGLRAKGYFDVRRLDGTVLHHSAKYDTLRSLEHPLTFRLERYSTESEAAVSGVIFYEINATELTEEQKLWLNAERYAKQRDKQGQVTLDKYLEANKVLDSAAEGSEEYKKALHTVELYEKQA